MNWQEKHKKEINVLFECIENKFSINREELISKSRKNNLVMARRVFMSTLFEVFEEDKLTHREISKIVNRDRASFIHNYNKHLDEYSRYKDYKTDYDSFKEEFLLKIKNV